MPQHMPQHMPMHSRSVASTPVAPRPVSVDRLQQIWASLPAADRQVLLGHDSAELSAADKLRLAKLLTALGKRRRTA